MAKEGDDNRGLNVATNPNTPWKSIQKAASSVPGGATVIISGGTYNEKVTINNSCNGTVSKLTVFKNKDGESVIIHGGKPNPDVSVVHFVGQFKLEGVAFLKNSRDESSKCKLVWI